MSIEAMKQARDFISRLKFADAEPEPEIVMAVLDQAIAEAEKQERFFCERCGKRLSGGIHTCTPPAEAEKQEPVACPYPCGWDNLLSIIIKKGAYLATSTLGDEEPLSEYHRQEMMLIIGYAKTLASWGKTTYSQPKREWVGLTDEDKQIAFDDTQEASGGFWEFADAIEAKLKEKNT